jgi:hypothetical protein
LAHLYVIKTTYAKSVSNLTVFFLSRKPSNHTTILIECALLRYFMWNFFNNTCPIDANPSYSSGQSQAPACYGPYGLPALITTTTAVTLLSAFMLYRKCQTTAKPTKISTAFASNYSNNCGLHSIIHTLSAQPLTLELEIRALPFFEMLRTEFFRYYQLFPANTDKLALLDQRLSHPWDQEILWGPVYRNVLRQFTDGNDAIELHQGGFIADETLALLCSALQANLVVYDQDEMHMRSEHYQPVIRHDIRDAKWTVELVYAGGHYNFILPNIDMMRDFNTHRRNIGGSLLHHCISHTKDGEPDYERHEHEIRAQVQNQYRSLFQSATPRI